MERAIELMTELAVDVFAAPRALEIEAGASANLARGPWCQCTVLFDPGFDELPFEDPDGDEPDEN